MIRKLKMGGSVLLMALVVQALLAVGAGAEFKSSSSHAILTGTQGTTQQFTPAPGVPAISCNTEWGTTLSSSVSADLTVSPVYGFCFDSFGRRTHVSFPFPQQTLTTESVHKTGHMTYTVTGSGSVNCVITVGSQTNNGISYKNLGGTKGTEVVTNSTNIVSTITGGFLNCGVKNGEYKEGTYTGTTVVTAKDTAGNPVEFNKLP